MKWLSYMVLEKGPLYRNNNVLIIRASNHDFSM